jgi:hypothetical protein
MIGGYDHRWHHRIIVSTIGSSSSIDGCDDEIDDPMRLCAIDDEIIDHQIQAI